MPEAFELCPLSARQINHMVVSNKSETETVNQNDLDCVTLDAVFVYRMWVRALAQECVCE